MSITQPITENAFRSADLNKIILTALDSVDPRKCVARALKRENDLLTIQDHVVNLKEYHTIYLIGVGKAVLPMASAVSEILGDLIIEGELIAKYDNAEIHSELKNSIRLHIGDHPIPSEKSIDATRQLLEMLKKTTQEDLVIGLISGGGSALMTHPVKGVGLAGLQRTTASLLKCGATIEEMNTIRKHLDSIKGGGLLKHIQPAKSFHLILSDVLGDPLSMIASGPTCSDPTTFCDCLEIIKKYRIEDHLDKDVLTYLENGATGLHEETLKDENPLLADHKNYIIGSLSIAADAAYRQAIKAGFKARILTTTLRGEAREVGAKLASQLAELVQKKKKSDKPICLIAGGETTVTVKGNGKGGRNQELALSAAQKIEGLQDCAFVSFATDGEDGPTDAAGGFVTGDTIRIARNMNLESQDFLDNNNAYEFLKRTGSLIYTGPTGTNVNDLVLMFAF